MELSAQEDQAHTNQNTLKIVHQNINWLSKKIDRLDHLLSNEDPDFLIVTEHGLPQVNLEKTCIEGYSLVGGFTRQDHIKGGVAGYIKKGQEKQAKLVETSGVETELVCETALFEIKTKKLSIQVLGVYRPPSAKLDSSIEVLTEQLDRIMSTNKQTVLMGDINVDNLTESNDNTKLQELLATYGITRMNLPPTRITSETEKSIDWICTNIHPELIKTTVILTGLSDHTAQTITIKAPKIIPKITKERRRLFTNTEITLFKERLHTQTWHQILMEEDVNHAYNTFHNIIKLILNETCPLRIVKGRQSKKRQVWDDECSRLKNAYLKALDEEVRTGLAEHKAHTAEIKKEYDQRLKHLRRERTTASIEKAENKSKALWQTINNERKATSHTNNQINLQLNGKLINDPYEIANHFNEFFATIAENTLQTNNSNTSTTYPDLPLITNQKLQFQPTTYEEVKKAIDTLKPKTSSGTDEISAKLVKRCKEELTVPLTDLINKSLQQGTFPTLLKTSKIYPKYKKGEQTEPGSYRPISLISTFSKIFEKIVLTRLLNHLEQHNLLTNKQHGFLKGRSTTTALIQLTDHIIDQLEESSTATSLFLDFSKAFDCLNHDQLLQKLRSLGIGGKESEWFKSYLKGRKQLVEINFTKNNTNNKMHSTTTDVKRGVPQGSVLGPVLFLLLTNDMPNWLDDICSTVMYADDTVLTVSNKAIETLEINTTTCLNQTKQYCINNDLVLNENKTVQIVFNTRNKITNVTPLPGLQISNTTKYLGITIDSKMSWKPHIDQLNKKLSSSTYVIRRIRQVCGLDVAKVAYFALFESHLRYGIVSWGGTAASNMEKILIQQKRAIRCLAGISYQESCREPFRQLKILTVTSIYIRETILHAIATQQLRHHDLHTYNTRHGSNFTLPPHRLTLFEKKPSYKGALFYNHLPAQLRNQPPQCFRNQLTKWLQERPYYSESEFLNT